MKTSSTFVSLALLFATPGATTLAQDGTDFAFTNAANNNSILLTSAMNNIALQNTLPQPKRDEGYRTSVPFSAAAGLQLQYSQAFDLTKTVQSEFLARARQANPAAAQQVAVQFAKYNPSEIFARFAKAAGVPFRDPSSSMAIYTVIGWGIANNNYPDPNNATDMARVRAVRTQMIPLIGAQANMVRPETRQRLDEELMILSVLLDAGHTSAKSGREGAGALAKFSDGVHAMWLKQFGKDLRKLALTDQGLIKK